MQIYAVQGALLNVTVAVDIAAGEATFTWSSANMEVYRRELGEEGMGTWNLQGSVSPGTSYTDTGLVTGKTYEYRILKDNGRTTFACITIDAPLEDDRGAVMLVVDNTMLPQLANEVRQYEMDLSADGWEVVRLDFDRHGTGTPEDLKIAIQNAVTAKPSLNSVILFGTLPVIWSGYLRYE